MAKYYGVVGYAETVDNYTGVWVERVIEKKYRGDVIRNTKRFENGEGINDNINVSNVISILADAYAFKHFFAIRYVEWMGTRWKVSSVEVDHPRLKLTLGGVYNGPES